MKRKLAKKQKKAKSKYCDFDLAKAGSIINEREGLVWNREKFDL